MTGHTMTILVCDDDASIRQLARAILAADGYEFREAVDVPSAIEALTASPPGLLMLDLGVPGEGGGRAVLAHVRATPELSDVRVLLVTGATEARQDGWGRSIGADGHLLKPFTLDGLRETVRELVG